MDITSRWKSVLVCLFVAAGVIAASSISAGPFDGAMRAYLRKDYAVAHRLFLPLAEQGDKIAQVNLGYIYGTGQGVQKNSTRAFKWYRMAAEQGRVMAESGV